MFKIVLQNPTVSNFLKVIIESYFKDIPWDEDVSIHLNKSSDVFSDIVEDYLKARDTYADNPDLLLAYLDVLLSIQRVLEEKLDVRYNIFHYHSFNEVCFLPDGTLCLILD